MEKIFLHIIIILFFIVGCSDNKKQVSHENHSIQGHEGMEMPARPSGGEEIPRMNHQQKNSDTALQNVLAPANKTILSNAETIHPVIKNITQTIHVSGYIAFDERKNKKVAVRIGGRIEKLYVKLNYQYVHK